MVRVSGKKGLVRRTQGPLAPRCDGWRPGQRLDRPLPAGPAPPPPSSLPQPAPSSPTRPRLFFADLSHLICKGRCGVNSKSSQGTGKRAPGPHTTCVRLYIDSQHLLHAVTLFLTPLSLYLKLFIWRSLEIPMQLLEMMQKNPTYPLPGSVRCYRLAKL